MPVARGDRAWAVRIAGVVVLAVLVRGAHAWWMAGDLLFDYPVIDPRGAWLRAGQLAAGDWWGPPQAYWKPPLYEYFLALHIAIFGPSAWPVRTTQILLDAASCLMAFLATRELVGRRVGLVAAIAMALYGPLVYFSVVRVSTSLSVFLEWAVLLLALMVLRRPAALPVFGCGVALGLLVLTRAEALLFLPGIGVWFWIALRGRPWQQRLRWIGLLTAGVLLAVAPVSLRNRYYAQDPVLISANGGINFYVGTSPSYRGIIGVRPGPEWQALARRPLDEGYRKRSERSAYHAREARRLIAADPAGYLGRLLRKTGHFWHGRELASNRDPYLARERSPVLAVLMWETPLLSFPFGLLAPIGLAGAVLAIRRRRPSRGVVGLLVIQWLVVIGFFVTGRFRIAAVPLLILLAAEAGQWSLRCWREGRRRTLAYACGAVVLLAIPLNAGAVLRSDVAAYDRLLRAEEHHYRGTVLLVEQQRFAEAATELERAVELEPTRALSHFNLGQAREGQGDLPGALDAFARALSLAESLAFEREIPAQVIGRVGVIAERLRRGPALSLAMRRIVEGLVCLDHRDWRCAVTALTAAHSAPGEMRTGPFLMLAQRERGRAALLAGRDDEAYRSLVGAAALPSSGTDVQLLLGIASGRVGRSDEARAAFAQFLVRERAPGRFFRAAREAGSPALRQLGVEAAGAILHHFPDDPALREDLGAAFP